MPARPAPKIMCNGSTEGEYEPTTCMQCRQPPDVPEAQVTWAGQWHGDAPLPAHHRFTLPEVERSSCVFARSAFGLADLIRRFDRHGIRTADRAIPIQQPRRVKLAGHDALRGLHLNGLCFEGFG